MRLDTVHRDIQKNKRRKRVGRGPGSGHGKTSSRGHKGQGQLAGWSQHPAFQGGTMPVVRRIPKRGFNNRWAKSVFAVNLHVLESRFEDGDEITPEILRTKGLAKGRYDLLKILGEGELTKKLTISAHQFSASANKKITAAGGKAIVIELGKAENSKEASTAKEAKDQTS